MHGLALGLIQLHKHIVKLKLRKQMKETTMPAKCNHRWITDTSKMLLTDPPKYEQKCEICGAAGTVLAHDFHATLRQYHPTPAKEEKLTRKYHRPMFEPSHPSEVIHHVHNTPIRYDGPKEAPFGYCPECAEAGGQRERRPNGYDTCLNGHRYLSAHAVYPDEKPMSQPPHPSDPGSTYPAPQLIATAVLMYNQEIDFNNAYHDLLTSCNIPGMNGLMVNVAKDQANMIVRLLKENGYDIVHTPPRTK